MALKGHKRTDAERKAIKKFYSSDRGKKTRLPTDAEYRVALKAYVLALCGPSGQTRCSWPECQVDDPDCLSIDHVYNDGRLHRISGNELYRQIKRDGNSEGRFQTLCYNHQWKKELERRRNEREMRFQALEAKLADDPIYAA